MAPVTGPINSPSYDVHPRGAASGRAPHPAVHVEGRYALAGRADHQEAGEWASVGLVVASQQPPGGLPHGTPGAGLGMIGGGRARMLRPGHRAVGLRHCRRDAIRAASWPRGRVASAARALCRMCAEAVPLGPSKRRVRAAQGLDRAGRRRFSLRVRALRNMNPDEVDFLKTGQPNGEGNLPMTASPTGPSNDPWTIIGSIAAVIGVIVAVIAIIVSHQDAGPSPATQSGSTVDSTDVNPSRDPQAGATSRTGSFTLAQGYSVNLDTNSPNWNIHRGCGSCDFWLQGSLTGGYGGDVAQLSSSQSLDYPTCVATTQYSAIQGQDLEPGVNICAKTKSGVFAGLTVQNVEADSSGRTSAVTFSVIVWGS